MSYFLMISGVIAILVGVLLPSFRYAQFIFGVGVGIGIVVLLNLSNIPIQGIFGSGSEWFWAMAQFLVIAFTLFFITYQINLQRLSNALSSLHTLREQWNSEMMCNARKGICENQNPLSRTISEHEGPVLTFFEEIGVYLEYGVISEMMIWDVYSYWIENYWLILEPYIKEYRNNVSDKTLFERFQSLHKRISNINRRRGTPENKSDERLQKFRAREIQDCNNILTMFGTEPINKANS
jgi:Domain of unknown function (DUF4760)